MEPKEHKEKYAKELMSDYLPDIMKLYPYIRYLEKLSVDNAAKNYTDQGIGENSIPVPVYDSQLLSFVRTAQSTKLLDRNYPYIYSRHQIKTHEDENHLIEQATYREMDILCGILSYYVSGGMVKGSVWVEAVQYGIFCKVIRKMKEIADLWV